MATGIPVAVGELIDTATINTWARGYLRKNTSKAVASSGSTTWVDLLNAEFTLPAGAMSTDKIVRLTAWGDWKNNAGTKDIPSFRFGLGGTTLIDTGASGGNNTLANTSRFGWRIVCEVQNLGATNSQQAALAGWMNAYTTGSSTTALSPFTTGNGSVFLTCGPSGPGGQGIVAYNGNAVSGTDFTAVDTTASCAVTFKVANAFNSASYDTTLRGALCEVI